MIKNCTKFVLIAGIGFSLFSGSSQAALTTMDSVDSLTIMSPGVTAPSRLGALGLIHDDEQRFSVLRENGEINEIPNHLVAKDLRGISQSEIKARLDNNINFRVQQGSDGEFSIQECGGLKGGLPEKTEETMDETDNTLEAMGQVGKAVLVVLKIWSTMQEINRLTTEGQREDNLNQIELDYITCLRKNPLKKDIDGTLRTPSECEESFNKFKMTADAMKMRKATRLVENEHNAQQVRLDSSAYLPKNPRLDFEECLRQNPLSENTVGIPSACIGQFNRLKMAVDAMKVYEDTTQN